MRPLDEQLNHGTNTIHERTALQNGFRNTPVEEMVRKFRRHLMRITNQFLQLRNVKDRMNRR